MPAPPPQMRPQLTSKQLTRLKALLALRASYVESENELEELVCRAYYARQIRQDQAITLGSYTNRSAFLRMCNARRETWKNEDTELCPCNLPRAEHTIALHQINAYD